MTRRLGALVGIRVVAVAMMAGLGCGRTELNLCKTGEPCHTSSTTCPGGNCDGGQPDGPTTCAEGMEVCGASCTDVRTDPANCGSCGNRCGATQTCRNGGCGCSAPGQTACGDECVLTATDPNHCGSCDHACGGGQSCQAGSCV